MFRVLDHIRFQWYTMPYHYITIFYHYFGTQKHEEAIRKPYAIRVL
jgi:hypothetical protein